MKSSAAEKLPFPGQEYTVYSFESADKKAMRRWHRHETLTIEEQAVVLARSLYKSGKYQRIEVKRKYFDRRINRHVDTIFKTYESGLRLRIGPVAVLALAAACGAAVFGVYCLVA